jgi:hypothetical protein
LAQDAAEAGNKEKGTDLCRCLNTVVHTGLAFGDSYKVRNALVWLIASASIDDVVHGRSVLSRR